MKKKSIDRLTAMEHEFRFKNVIGTWERVATSGRVAFVKTGLLPETDSAFCGAVIDGQYNEAFQIIGYGPDSLEELADDVRQTVRSLRL